ncbi:MAG: hypothetical protein ABW277_22620 [Longimicrobiaceae bacterium]
MSELQQEVSNGILIAPPGQTKIPEGSHIKAAVPPVMDLDEASTRIDGPMLALCGVVRSAEPDRHPAFSYVRDAFVLPELAGRAAEGQAPDSTPGIGGALVVFPAEAPPQRRVYLDDEVRVHAEVRVKYGAVRAGEPLRAGDLYDLANLRLEGVREGKDGFFWVTQEPGRFALYFDLVPVLGGEGMGAEVREALHREILDGMAQELLRGFLRLAFEEGAQVQEGMAADGWVPAPGLLPEPWTSMCRAYGEGRQGDAEALAAGAFTAERADLMLDAWCADEPFASERGFLETAVRRYFAEDYISSVSVALPRLEGIANRVRRDNQLRAENSISRAMEGLDDLSSGPTKGRWLRGQVLERFEVFVERFLDRHTNARAQGAVLVRGRHGHAHGASDASVYDRRYALQVLLAVDALHFILKR